MHNLHWNSAYCYDLNEWRKNGEYKIRFQKLSSDNYNDLANDGDSYLIIKYTVDFNKLLRDSKIFLLDN